VAFSEIERFLDTPVKRYSSGMYIRLAFAVAAHLEPEILVVDEVLAVGDIDFQKRCLGKMNDVVGQGRTVFFVSHNTQSIAALTNRCLVMKAGRLVLDAPTAEAVKYYVEMTLKGSSLGQPFKSQRTDSDANYIAEAQVITAEPCGQQPWGRPIAFDFVIHVGSPMSKLCFMFWIADTQGAHITHCWQFDEDQPYQSTAGDYRIRCEIPRLRLYKGVYSVTAWISDTRGLLPIDAQTQICQFEVHMGDFHRKGFEWRDEHATYLEDAEWVPVTAL
jgi:lipopolysaccharide transport system ATP-binding protein